MSEIKTPQAGEWWGDDSGPAFYMIGRNTLGQMVYEVRSRSRSYIENDTTNYWADAVHLPDCTGWDWKEPDWVELDPVNYGWHVLRAGVDQCRPKDGRWGYVTVTAGHPIHQTNDLQFRCLRKDLPVKPPEPAITSGGPYVSIEVHQAVIAERDALQDRLREIEDKAKF